MLELGIDDAGRGPVIGPMVLAGCLIDEKTAKEFKELGVKDSKQLTQKRREFLDEKIKEKAETFEIVIVPPKVIDGERFHEGENKNQFRVGSGGGGNGAKRIKLNELEAIACAEIINKINKGFNKIKIIIDCPSTNLTAWRDSVRIKIENLSNLEIYCEHKADKNHVSVSAASILAKNIREKEMALLKKKYGNKIGSGYTSDPLTQKFLKENIKKYQNHGIFRKTWSTWKNAMSKTEQKKLGDF